MCAHVCVRVFICVRGCLSFLNHISFHLRRVAVMGCYGIGVSRLLAAALEVMSRDEKRIAWPRRFAPYSVHVISLGQPEVSADWTF